LGAAQRIDPSSTTLRGLLAAAAAVVILLGMREAAAIVSTLLLAFVITIGIAPMPKRLSRRMPTWLAFVVSVLVVIVVLLLLVLLLGGTLVSFVDTLPEYQGRFDELVQGTESLVESLGVDLRTVDVTSFLSLERIASVIGAAARSIIDALSNASLLFILIFFMLLDSMGYPGRVRDALAHGSEAYSEWDAFVTNTRRYLSITAVTGLGVAVVDFLVLLVMGVDFALLWAVLAFLFSFIPNIGFVLSLIPPAFLALLQFGLTEAVIVVVAFVVINSLVDNVIKPRVLGGGLDLSIATTFLSLIVWGWVLGPVGAILAIPLTLFVKQVVLGIEHEESLLSLAMSGSTSSEE
jgi:AI-2 transport protein TqsA